MLKNSMYRIVAEEYYVQLSLEQKPLLKISIGQTLIIFSISLKKAPC